ncbi:MULTISPECIES: RDD family protein [Micromonospora]|uniref:RDD family protein n=1 Tax=Micromonospora yangpuensis TaxID=683228 RepID=A0A1C6TWR6_9ACTN|nr:RDD family protein [Micromonospora yangpuensis]GGM01457.1 proline-rich antigen (36 kDa antigen) [Micromonospora yangpuensis]SCL46197.1 RDD family protein [Micromonospora yangpuensis]
MKFSGWFVRAGAYLVDFLIAAPFFLVAGLLGEPANPVLYYSLAAAGSAVWAYNRWWLAGRTGQSWGRRLVGIQLLGAGSKRPAGPVRAAVRDLAHGLDGLVFFVGYLFPLFTAKRQTIADMVTRTVVTAR